MATTDLKHIRAAVIDGRAASPRFKQRQISELHAALIKNKTQLCQAVQDDSGCTSTESEIDFCLVLKAVSQFYNQLNFSEMLSDEYKIATQQDRPDARKPYGCALITPSTRHGALYSSIVPLAAAIAAGNCVVLELPTTLSALGSLLRNILPQTLDFDTFAIVEKTELRQDFRDQHCVELDCRADSSGKQASLRSLQTPRSKVVATIDQTADLEQAARQIVQARFGFGGTSDYAPDLVLVNEFCIKAFAQAVAQETTRFMAARVQDASSSQYVGRSDRANGSVKKPNSRSAAATDLAKLQKELNDADAEVLYTSARGTVAIIRQQDNALVTRQKLDAPLLLLLPISSMDDAIDLMNKQVLSEVGEGTHQLAALYLFTTPAAAKYMSQFMRSLLTFTNHIPVELLVGPQAVLGHETALSLRYTPDMFSYPRPELIVPSKESQILATALEHDSVNTKQGSLEAALGADKLTPMNEPIGGSINFFEQGLLTGAGIGLVTLLSTAVTAGWLGWKYVVPSIARYR